MMLDDRHVERFCRQIIVPEIGAAGQEGLLRGRVLLSDLSPPGTTALVYLAAAGVRHFGAAGLTGDVAPMDATAPFGVTMAHVGHPRATALAEVIRRVNPEATVETPMDGTGIEPGSWDVVLASGGDTARLRRTNVLCLEAHVPLIAVAAGARGGCLVGLAGHDPEAPCVACVTDLETRLDMGDPREATNAVAAGIIGALAAVEAVKQLLGIGAPPAGRFIRYDPSAAELQTASLQKDPRCALCGPGRARRDARADQRRP